ncbi:tigger transposable element-derived protein 6-like [Protopterus annectens]|uniref:tigger transposable element-derived protein 6-like n=1 Tax=Protopterus annectens TaxID=7888 RepID=UPI001CF936BB|nr:tigger transposable element-derived protein 6-like [Protopterus annectens]
MATKRKRTDLGIAQKCEICLYKDKNPGASQEEIAAHFNCEWKTVISRRTIGDILSQKNKWSVGQSVVCGARTEPKRMRNAENVEMGKALFLWFTKMRGKHAVVTDAILTKKACYFGSKMGVTDFTYSTGCLSRFKARYDISMKVICGESEGVDPVTVAVGHYETRQIISQYSANDVYNCDESALFFRTPPGKILSAGLVCGTKRYKDRVTVMFCCNATGTNKRKVLVIGKSKQPRCFQNFSVQLYVDYVHSRKGWMNSSLFLDFVSKLNADILCQDPNILLLLDNASSHPADVELANVTFCFLPPNTTSHLQPLDAGIKCFKSHYRKLQLQHIVQMMDADSDPDVNLKEAVSFIRAAWKNVSPLVIQNCWAHAGLIDKGSLATNTHDMTESVPAVTSAQLSDIQAILMKLPAAASLFDSC